MKNYTPVIIPVGEEPWEMLISLGAHRIIGGDAWIAFLTPEALTKFNDREEVIVEKDLFSFPHTMTYFLST